MLLGVRVLDGKGDHLSFGGRVMKNVAGFDVSRVLAGSLGQLGLITEVTLKVLPLPPATASTWRGRAASAAPKRPSGSITSRWSPGFSAW